MSDPRRSSVGTRLVGLGWSLYFVSFFLPALQGTSFAWGYQAFWGSFQAIFYVFFEGFIVFLPAALACLGNLVMVCSLVEFIRPGRGRRLWGIPELLLGLTPVNLLGLIPALTGGTSPAIGFWVWAASYPLVAIGLFLRRGAMHAPAPALPSLTPRSWGR